MTTGTKALGRRARSVAALALCWGLASLTWRVGWSLHDASPWLSLPLLAAEIWTFVRLALFAASAWRVPDAEPTRAAPTADGGRSVELIVPAAHAGVEDVGRTLVVAAAEAPDRVRVLDDRHRTDVELEARRHGADYQVVSTDLDGPAPSSIRLASAALADSEFDLVIWVDAGDVLAPDLQSLTAAFERADVAVVQAATEYSNRDSLLHTAPDRDERAVDARVIGPALGAIGAGPWTGSGSVIRTAALHDVGGLTVGDAAVRRASARLVSSSWRIEFCERPVVRVTAPDTLDEYLAAAAADAADGWHSLRSPDSPLLRRSLPIRARLGMIEHATRPIDGLARLTFLVVLAATMFTGRLPLTASLATLALLWVPAFALRLEALVALSRGTVRRGDIARQGLRRMGLQLQIIGGRRPATGSPDGPQARSASRSVRIAGQLPLVTAAAVVLNTGIILRALTFWFPHLLRPLDDTARIAVMAIAVATLIPIVDVLQVLLTRQQRRTSHRITATLSAEVDGATCSAHDLTPHGLGVDLAVAPAIGDRLEIVLSVPRVTGTIDQVRLEGVVKHVSEPATGTRASTDRTTHRVGIELLGVTPAARDALVEVCALTAQERDVTRERVAHLDPAHLDLRTGSVWRTGLAALNVVGLLTAGLVVIGAPAGAETKGEAAAPPAEPAVILGRVADDRGASVPNVCVSIDGSKSEPIATDAEGAFVLDALAAGDHLVKATDCRGIGGFVTTYHPSATSAAAASAVHVEPGEKVGIEITLVPAGRVYGAVLDRDRVPVDSVCVAYAAAGDDTLLDVATTDKEGRFEADVPAGRGTFRFTDCAVPARYSETWFPGAPDRASSKDVDVPAHDKHSLDDVVMRSRPRLSGRVMDQDDRPLDDICVSVQDVVDGALTGLAFTTTDAEGNYELSAPTGTHSLLFQDCTDGRGLVPVWFGGEPRFANPAPTIDIRDDDQGSLDQRMYTGGRISGVVVDPDGAAASDVCVAIHPAKQLLDRNDWTMASWSSADRDTGEWTSQPLPEGPYLVQYTNCDEQGYTSTGRWREEFLDGVFSGDDGADVRNSKVIEVRRGEKPTWIDHTMSPTRGLRGIVSARRGAGAPEVCVGSTPGSGSTRTAEDGGWSLELPEGDYRLTFTDCRNGRGLTQVTVGATVEKGRVSTVDVQMRARPSGTLLGSVSTVEGNRLGGACVVAYVPNDVPAVTTVGEDGNWQISGLGAGSYWLAAINCTDPNEPMVDPRRPKEGYPSTWFPSAAVTLEVDAQPDQDGAKSISLDPGAVLEGLDICLTACGANPTDPQPTTTAPATTSPATTAAPTTTAPTTAPPTTVPPVTTTAPASTTTSTSTPRTTVPATTPPITTPVTTTPPRAPQTSAAPTTTVPLATTTVAPTTTTPNTSDADTGRPTTASGRWATTNVVPRTGHGGDTVTETDGTDPTADVATGRPSGPISADTAARTLGARSTERTVDIAARWVDRTKVAGISTETTRRTPTDHPAELASRETTPTAGTAAPATGRGWVVFCGFGLILLAGFGLLASRRRASGTG